MQFPLIGSLAENGLTFISYGFFKRLAGVKGIEIAILLNVVDPEHITFSQMLFSSMGAGATISLLLTPVELLKCRLQIEQSQPKSVAKTTSLGVIRNVLKADGFTGLFRGLSLTLLRELPGTSIWMIVYDSFAMPTLDTNSPSSPLSGRAIHALLFRFLASLPLDRLGFLAFFDSFSVELHTGRPSIRSTPSNPFFRQTLHCTSKQKGIDGRRLRNLWEYGECSEVLDAH